ncbi:MAG: hypothetical protein R2706_17995 [Acidimicrobiales bacterium]
MVTGLVVLLTLVNGLSPYLGLKTSTSFNMYSNLVVRDGASNHFVISSTGSIRAEVSDLITITASNDPGLAGYIDSGLLVPMVNVADYLAKHPERVADLRTGRHRYRHHTLATNHTSSGSKASSPRNWRSFVQSQPPIPPVVSLPGAWPGNRTISLA